jgi:hypothetical protein
VGRFWKPCGNKGLYIPYFTFIVLSKFDHYVVWVRPQYNEPLEVLTVLISQCFSFFNSRLKNYSTTLRIFFGRKVLVRV